MYRRPSRSHPRRPALLPPPKRQPILLHAPRNGHLSCHRDDLHIQFNVVERSKQYFEVYVQGFSHSATIQSKVFQMLNRESRIILLCPYGPGFTPEKSATFGESPPSNETIQLEDLEVDGIYYYFVLLGINETITPSRTSQTDGAGCRHDFVVQGSEILILCLQLCKNSDEHCSSNSLETNGEE